MKLTVALIPDEGQSIELTSKLGWVRKMIRQAFPDEKPAEETIKGFVNISRVEEQIHFEGEVGVTFHPTCDRCLRSFPFPFLAPVKMDLAPLQESSNEKGGKNRRNKRAAMEEEEEIRLTKDDLEFTFYEGPEIDFQELIREQIVLSLPVRYLCLENCKGLCSQCGVNLNEGSCSCSQEGKIDLRWESLRHLKPK